MDKVLLGTELSSGHCSFYSMKCPCLIYQSDPHLTQGLQSLPVSLFRGKEGQLVELQLGGRGSDVQEVGEGLAQGAGGQPLVFDPVAS